MLYSMLAYETLPRLIEYQLGGEPFPAPSRHSQLLLKGHAKSFAGRCQHMHHDR